MDRSAFYDLQKWQNLPDRMPLLIRGARQVGKTYLIETFARVCFENFININFELQPEYKQCFTALEPTTIVNAIAALSGQALISGKTLLFLDEIQNCPAAIMALRYFKEKMPSLHVIAAGSLLEFALREESLSMPVGRVEYYYLKPLSFCEFLHVMGFDSLLETLRRCSLHQPPHPAVHQRLLDVMQEYTVLGGMPAAIANYLTYHDFQAVERQQTIILSTYRDDFGKYAKLSDHKFLQQVFERAPGLVGQNIGYHKISPDHRSRDLQRAIVDLNDARVIQSVYATKASGLPLNATKIEKRFKLLFLDIGLMYRSMGLGYAALVQDKMILLTRGMLAEQLVGQELLAYGPGTDDAHLYYWERNKTGSQAEVDYVIAEKGHIIPIEVKAGATGALRSLQQFLHEHNCPLGVRVSSMPLSLDRNILTVPFYLISELPRLYFEAMGE